MQVDGKIMHYTAEMVLLFNRFFQSAFGIGGDRCILHFDEPSLCATYISKSEEGILPLLLSLNVKKSAGHNDIRNGFVKGYAQWVAKYITIF